MELNRTPDSPHPVFSADRIKSVDVVRGVALLGILLMNIPGFGLHWSNFFYLIKGPQDSVDFKTLQTIFIFFEGTMRGLFSMLFGAGMILFMMNKKEIPGAPTVAEYYYRRLLWLVLFGVFNAYVLLWRGDILFFYGIAGMLLFPFRNAGTRWLLTLSVLCLFVGLLKIDSNYQDLRNKRQAYHAAVKAEKEKKKLTPSQEQAKAEWQEMEKQRTTVDSTIVNKDLEAMHSNYPTIFRHLLPQNAGSETWGGYHGIWDSLTMMFLGMALFTVGFFSNKCNTSTYLLCLIIGYTIGITCSWAMFWKGVIGGVNIGQYVDQYRVGHEILYDWKRVFISLGHASLIMLVYRSQLVPWLMQALSNVGQMAFTNYLMQSIFCTFYFNGYGFDKYNELRFHQLYYVVIIIWIFQLIFSTIWLKYFRFGPFEWLWRSLTYWKLQPMRLHRAEPVANFDKELA